MEESHLKIAKKYLEAIHKKEIAEIYFEDGSGLSFIFKFKGEKSFTYKRI